MNKFAIYKFNSMLDLFDGLPSDCGEAVGLSNCLKRTLFLASCCSGTAKKKGNYKLYCSAFTDIDCMALLQDMLL